MAWMYAGTLIHRKRGSILKHLDLPFLGDPYRNMRNLRNGVSRQLDITMFHFARLSLESLGKGDENGGGGLIHGVPLGGALDE
jgi:hypothetical protein